MKARGKALIRYGDQGSHAWILKEAPCSWRGNIEVEFLELSIRRLEPAGSWTHPEIVSKWLQTMTSGRTVPPLIVCATERGTFYIRDGNHRYQAMCELFTDDPDAQIRVAQVVPKADYHFRYRWFGTYGTYVLEPVLLAMPPCTRETGGCAALLERLLDPVAGMPPQGERAAICTFDGRPAADGISEDAVALSVQ